jgi:hypothetical protein
MVLEAIALWRALVVVTGLLRDPDQPERASTFSLGLDQPRRLALWATGLLVVCASLGALYGPLLARYADQLRPLG